MHKQHNEPKKCIVGVIIEFKRTQIFSGFLWRFFEKLSAQVLGFIVSIILARLLEPSMFGSVALVMVFITILNVFIDSGFGNALIQKKDADQLDYCTVFYFNIVMCVVLYIILFACAPLISNFYNDENLTDVVRVLGLTIIFSAFGAMQGVYIGKHLWFRKSFIVNIITSCIGAVVGVTLAYTGFGIWAIVFQQVTSSFIRTVSLWFVVRWRPKLIFSFERLKSLFDFGWKLLVSYIINTIYVQFNQLIIGKVYTSESLAFYNRGQMFPAVIVDNVNSSIDAVLFPTMSYTQDNVTRVKEMTQRAIKTSVYFIAPCMIGMAFIADILVPVILTEKWSPCIFFLRIFCFTYLFYPIHTANLNAIKALGRSDLFLKLEILKKIVGLTAILITVWISVEAMAISLLFTSVASQIINSYPNKKLLNYSYLQQLKDILPEILLAVLMGLCVYWLRFLPFHYAVILLVQVILGALIYYFGSRILKLDSYCYAVRLLKDIFKQKKS